MFSALVFVIVVVIPFCLLYYEEVDEVEVLGKKTTKVARRRRGPRARARARARLGRVGHGPRNGAARRGRATVAVLRRSRRAGREWCALSWGRGVAAATL